jgi:molybdopterin/thiamine biosynthesis adenylyltransferase
MIFKGVKIKNRQGISVSDRQKRINGFNQDALKNAKVAQIGAGGIGSEICEGLARKGIGQIDICDFDSVEITNLNRQRFFEEDIGELKSVCLAKNLVRESTCGTVFKSYPYGFSEYLKRRRGRMPDLFVLGVDSYDVRFDGSVFLYENKIPGIFMGVTPDADSGYVMIQEPGSTCFACIFPRISKNRRKECPGIPAVKDILKTIGGIALFAIDSVLMGRKINWNFWFLSVSELGLDVKVKHPKREGCEICGSGGKDGIL